METDLDVLTFMKNLIEEQDKEFAVTKMAFEQLLLRTMSGLRKQAGFTQTTLAEALGVRQGRVAQIESGDRPSLRIETLLDYFYNLGFDVEINILEKGKIVGTVTTVEPEELSEEESKETE